MIGMKRSGQAAIELLADKAPAFAPWTRRSPAPTSRPSSAAHRMTVVKQSFENWARPT